MEAFRLLQENAQALTFIPIGMREVIVQGICPVPIFCMQDQRYVAYFTKGENISREKIQILVNLGVSELFVSQRDYHLLKEGLENLLRRTSRSLSMGAGTDHVKRLVNLLAIHMAMLFREPVNDSTLALHYQVVRALGAYLIEHRKCISDLYFSMEKFHHFYVFAQPVLSSLLYFGLLGHSQIFNNREMEVLFVTSYFKDLGLALLPHDLLRRDNLILHEKMTLASHANGSSKILQGRIPLAPNFLNMIENHHIHSLLDKKVRLHGNDSIMGIETLFMSMTDMVAAMGSSRPYRNKVDLFDALAYLKHLVVVDYPQEFRALVQYMQRMYQDQMIVSKAA